MFLWLNFQYLIWEFISENVIETITIHEVECGKLFLYIEVNA